MKLRIGMIGNGRIANRFVEECRAASEKLENQKDNKKLDGIEITCVYNPKQESAAEFAKKHRIPLATSDMEEFLGNVDAVYIAVPHQFHFDYAKSMLEAGKHVLCEKPMSLIESDVIELYELAEQKKLVLMEGIKTNYAPGFKEIIQRVKRGEIGTVIDVEAAFTRIPVANTRECWDIENGGSFTEFGSYALLPIVKLFGTKNLHADYHYVEGETGVDTYVKAHFYQTDEFGQTISYATAKTGLGTKSEGQLLISGTKGYILVPSPWWLTKKFEICREDPSWNQTITTEFEGAGLRYEIEAFVKMMQGEEVPEYLTAEESRWMAEQMDHFRNLKQYRRAERNRVYMAKMMETEASDDLDINEDVGIWAHRGCCFRYPENTIPAFLAAAKLQGLKGIELDIQLTKDGEMVVIHDEKVDATTTGTGAVADYTLAELQALQITGRGCEEPVDVASLKLEDMPEFDGNLRIPTIREVFEVLMPYLKKGLFINIELKNSNVRYEGMEQKILDLVQEMGLENNIIYSSFLPESMGVIKKLNPQAKTGILGGWVHWCTQKMQEFHADAVHPYTGGMDITKGAAKEFSGFPVRAWNMEEPFYGSKTGRFKDGNMLRYAKLGVTDLFTNVPEEYLV